MKNLTKRLLIYTLGVIILGLGITMNTKTTLGVSPIISVPFNLAQITGFKIGIVTSLYYCFLILLQFLLLKGKLPVVQWLQIAVSFVTGGAIQFFDALVPIPQTLPAKAVLLIAAIAVTALGAVIMLDMRLLPNPADGLTTVLGDKLNINLGLSKNILDFTCLLIALILGLGFSRSLLGVGAGTFVAMVLTGRFFALYRKILTPFLNRITAE